MQPGEGRWVGESALRRLVEYVKLPETITVSNQNTNFPTLLKLDPKIDTLFQIYQNSSKPYPLELHIPVNWLIRVRTTSRWCILCLYKQTTGKTFTSTLIWIWNLFLFWMCVCWYKRLEQSITTELQNETDEFRSHLLPSVQSFCCLSFTH